MFKPASPVALVDSSIIVADLFEEEKEHGDELMMYIDDIEEGNFKPVLSTPVLMEVLSVVRRKASEKFYQEIAKISQMRDEEKETYTKTVLSKIQSYAQNDFEELEHRLQEGVFKWEKNVSVRFDEDSLKFMKKYVGILGGKSVTRFKSLSIGDILHIITAKQLKCDRFLTFDTAFESIKNDPFLKGLVIHVYKK
jgi:predicted nucleic acid-binding protein